jgi:hypothetical protein
MIYYVEMGVAFTNTYGDIYDQFYDSMISMYSNVMKKVSGNAVLTNLFRARLEKIVSNTSGIGWGFHDSLVELFTEYIEELD